MARGEPKQMATWPAFGQNSYITHAIWGVPNTHHGD